MDKDLFKKLAQQRPPEEPESAGEADDLFAALEKHGLTILDLSSAEAAYVMASDDAETRAAFLEDIAKRKAAGIEPEEDDDLSDVFGDLGDDDLDDGLSDPDAPTFESLDDHADRLEL